MELLDWCENSALLSWVYEAYVYDGVAANADVTAWLNKTVLGKLAQEVWPGASHLRYVVSVRRQSGRYSLCHCA